MLALKHYGVLGMHWGRRKSGGQVLTSKKGKKASYDPGSVHKMVQNKLTERKKKIESDHSDDHKEKLNLQKKKMHQMSNAELKKLNERLNLEKQYRDLNKGTLTIGKGFVKDMLKSSGKQVLGKGVTALMTEGGKALLKAALVAVV